MAAGTSFNVESFEQLIENHGYNCYWQQAIICECYKDGQPDFKCSLCEGRGWRYLPRKLIKVVSTSFTGSQELIVPGLKESGTVYVTPQNKNLFGYHDKLEFFEITSKHSQVIQMGYKKTTATHRNIKQVLFVVNGDYVYEENVDFVITCDRHHLEWINDEHKPSKGTNISILYTTTPIYMITDIVHELRSTRVSKGVVNPYTSEMPKQYQARRLDFVYGHTVNAKREEEPETKSILEGEFTYG